MAVRLQKEKVAKRERQEAKKCFIKISKDKLKKVVNK